MPTILCLWVVGALTIPLDKVGKTSHVPLSMVALRALLDLHRIHGKGVFVCGGANSPRYWFEAAVETAKIEGFTWHCLRHTFASRLVMSGADLRTVAELLRDKTLAMVMRYGSPLWSEWQPLFLV